MPVQQRNVQMMARFAAEMGISRSLMTSELSFIIQQCHTEPCRSPGAASEQ